MMSSYGLVNFEQKNAPDWVHLNLVVGEGFEPSKLSRQIYSLIPLTARESHLTKDHQMVPTAGIELATY